MQERIIRILERNRDRYLSLKDLQQEARVDKDVLLHHLGLLQDAEDLLLYLPDKGYKLADDFQPIHVDRLEAAEGIEFFSGKVHYLGIIDSTNNLLKDLGIAGLPEGTLVFAETQTGGKGRFNRKWCSPAGGLWFSFLLRPKLKPFQTAPITLLLALAIAKGIEDSCGLSVRIKWPNDLKINGQKVCGILTEMQTTSGEIDFIVAGIGINVNNTMNSFPEEVRQIGTTLQREAGRQIDREVLLRSILNHTANYYEAFLQHGFESFIQEWNSYSETIGKHVTAQMQHEEIKGIAVGINSSGALLVETDSGELKTVFSGEIA